MFGCSDMDVRTAFVSVIIRNNDLFSPLDEVSGARPIVNPESPGRTNSAGPEEPTIWNFPVRRSSWESGSVVVSRVRLAPLHPKL